MAGLPAAGKSSVAEGLGRALPAGVVAVDPVEAAMWSVVYNPTPVIPGADATVACLRERARRKATFCWMGRVGDLRLQPVAAS
ncbi:hypothetical protein ACWGMA_29695 [Streptomyces asiaticus]